LPRTVPSTPRDLNLPLAERSKFAFANFGWG
jgi:hypothetical protein